MKYKHRWQRQDVSTELCLRCGVVRIECDDDRKYYTNKEGIKKCRVKQEPPPMTISSATHSTAKPQ